ncbi:MAG TPA: NAD(P)H-dependent oxidoreductase [Gemmatimonadales bacterium]|nr:NAD(P)H-dependent oxidoreductase [Gemmatimonadales bacterium]
MTVKLLAFAASLRAESLNRRLIHAGVGVARELGAEVDLAEFREFEMPIYDGDRMQESGLPPGAALLKARIEAADGMLIASPEYNYTVGGPLKNAIDWVSRVRPMPFRGRTAFLMSTSNGIYGGVRGLWQLRIPLEGCGCFVFPDMFPLSHGPHAFEADGALKDPAQHTRLHGMLDHFLKATAALSAIRPA